MPPHQAADDDLLATVQRLFIEHAVEIRGFVTALMPDAAIVDDVVQETFMAITARAGDYDVSRSFTAWAYGFARRKVLEAAKRARRAARPFPEEVLEVLAATEADDALVRLRLRFLDDCIGQLAPQARAIVEHCYQRALKPAEVASLIGWTPASVHVALSRARAAIRSCLDRKLALADDLA